MKNNSFDEIRRKIEESDRIAISAHTNPDGDAVSSCCALALALEKKGKNVSVFLEDFSDKLKMIPYSEKILRKAENNDFDLLVALDCGDKERLGESRELAGRTYTINIDHHISNTYFGKLNFVDAEASSASELVYRLIDGWCGFDSNIAAAIYTGIIFDTGCFKHSSTTPLTMKIAGELMTYGIPFTEIQEKLFFSHTLAEAKLLSQAIKNMRLECGGRLAIASLSLEEIEENGATPKDADAIVSYIKNTSGVDAAVFFYEKKKGEIKASMRSNEALNVAEIAVKFGGGGHIRASGCTLHAGADGEVENIINELKRALEG